MKFKRVTALALSLVLLLALSSCGLTTTTDGLACKLNADRRTYTVEGYLLCEEGCYDTSVNGYDIETCTHHLTEITIDHYKKWPVSNVGSSAFENCKHLQTERRRNISQCIKTGTENFFHIPLQTFLICKRFLGSPGETVDRICIRIPTALRKIIMKKICTPALAEQKMTGN